MSRITIIGLDLAKNVFQVHGVDQRGRVVLRRRLSRAKVLPFFVNLPACLVGIEVCGGSNFWGRKLRELGHDVRQMSPQHVKPYVKTNKNDYNDAEAICEAVSRPNMRFVPIKSIEQQDIQILHRIRDKLVRKRTSVANQSRGFLLEYGIAVPKGLAKIRSQLPQILEDESNELSLLARDFLSDLYEQLVYLDEKITQYDRRMKVLFKQSEECQRIGKIPGIGPQTATAIVAAVGKASTFKNGRELAAWLGLVPRQHSSGGRDRLLGISKRGDVYLRKLLIHGARSVVRRCYLKKDRVSLWLQGLIARRGKNKAAVALANKNARMIWVLLAKQQEYKAA